MSVTPSLIPRPHPRGEGLAPFSIMHSCLQLNGAHQPSENTACVQLEQEPNLPTLRDYKTLNHGL